VSRAGFEPRIEYLPNASLERYRHTNLLGIIIIIIIIIIMHTAAASSAATSGTTTATPGHFHSISVCNILSMFM
jgi:hypothetical protein